MISSTTNSIYFFHTHSLIIVYLRHLVLTLPFPSSNSSYSLIYSSRKYTIPTTKARALYIYIYARIHSKDKTSYQGAFDIDRSRRRLANDIGSTVDGFLPGDSLITANRIQISRQSRPRRSTRFVSEIIRRVSDRISRETSGQAAGVSCKVSDRINN